MKNSILLLFLLKNYVKISLTIQLWGYSDNRYLEDDTKLNFTGLGYKYGMSAEEFDVQTKDGYVLKLFRIPGHGKPILLQHGFLDSADSFILRGPTSLPAILAVNGYDVWLGNIRGNKYSRRHVRLNPDRDEQFWNFSIHEHAKYDLPAMIDFILIKTGRSNLDYIGHSQGTTIMFILGAVRPDYNQKIELFIALCPVVFLQNVSLFNKLNILSGEIINNVLKSLHREELLGPNSIETRFVKDVCADRTDYFCLNVGVFPSAGFNPSELERSFIPVFFSHFPSGSSRKNLHHLLQIGLSGYFGHYNYGLENYAKYGSAVPPSYDLRKVTMPTILINSQNDGFSSIEDTIKLKAILPNVVDHVIVEPPTFNHIDFLMGRNAYKVVYPRILEMLQRCSFN